FQLPRAILNGSFLVALAAYVIWLLRFREDSLTLSPLMKKAAAFLALGFIAYPATTDVYTYLHFGTMGLRGVNPYLTPAGTIPMPEMPLFSNWTLTSPYGPLSQTIFMICALPARWSPILGVYVFKAFCLAAHVLNASLIWRMIGPGGLRGKLTMAYLVNPSLLSMHVAEAHLDVFVCTATILMIGGILSGRLFEAAVAAWAGVLIKTLPVLWLPLLAFTMVRRRAWKALGGSALVSLAIVGVLSVTLLPTLDAWKGLLNPATRGMAARSVHHLASLVLEHGPQLDPDQRWEALSQELLFCTIAFGIFYLWVWLKPLVRPDHSGASLVADLGWVTLALFLVATPWMMPWYPAILLPFAGLAGAPFFALCILVFSLSSGVIYGDGAGRGALSVMTTLVTIGPILATLLGVRKLSERAAGWFARFT